MSLPTPTEPRPEPEVVPAPPTRERRRRTVRRRWITAIVIVLLIGVPIGYLLVSAGQSRDSGRDKERKWSATGLTSGWPSQVQRRIYQVPLPDNAWHVAYYETNNWKTSRLYVQFRTTEDQLAVFLATYGATPEDLKQGKITISARNQSVTGWDFGVSGPWSSLTHQQDDPLPTHNITVTRRPTGEALVYLVATSTP